MARELGALSRRVDTGREGHGRADKPAPNRRFSNVRLQRRRFFQPEQGVSAQTLAGALLSDARVNAYAIFIAGEAEAESIRRAMPTGHSYICLDTATLPAIFKEMFAHSLLKEDMSSQPRSRY